MKLTKFTQPIGIEPSTPRPAKDLFRMTLRNKVQTVLTRADLLDKEAEDMVNNTTLLNNENNRTGIEVLRAKARGIRSTVWDLAEEEYKEFYSKQDPRDAE